MAIHDPTGVHYRSSEFLYRNWHYASGWYFYDEEEDLYGPFVSKAHCERGLQLYIDQLLRGASPTQLKPHERAALGQVIEGVLSQHQADPDIPEDILRDITKHH